MEFVSILIVAVSLSMDAFSLALAYGTLGLEKNLSWKISLSVGIFHFVMPLFGMIVKYYLVHYSGMPLHFITSAIYIYLGIMLLLDSKEERRVSNLCSFKDILLFSLAVSLDSFSVGIALENYTIVAPILYAVSSFSFTMMGLRLGKKLNSIFGKAATMVGGIIFLLLGIFHFL